MFFLIFSLSFTSFDTRPAWSADGARLAKYAPGEAIVVLKNQIGQLSAAALSDASGKRYVASAAASVEAKAVTTYASLSEAQGSIFVLMRSETKSTEELLAELKKNPDVLCASPNYRVRALREPNDPSYLNGELWGMKSIHANQAWDTTTGSDKIYVAVVDSGVYYEHEDLSPNIDRALSRNFVNPNGDDSTPVEDQNFIDGDGHGTHMAGTIVAVGDNSKGVAGVNWNGKVIVLKALDDEGSGFISWIVAALEYFAKLLRNNPELQVPAINLSLGAWDSDTPKQAQNSAFWQAFQNIDKINRTVIVVAAGNEGHQVGVPALFDIKESYIFKGDYCYPASFTGLNNLLVVGAISERNEAPSFSNWSSESVHLAAPGARIMSTYSPLSKSNGGLYNYVDGTSTAVPHVSGALALVASHRPDLSAHQLKNLLCSTADTSVNPKSPGTYGFYIIPPQNVPDRTLSKYGLVNVNAALTGEAPTTPVTGITVEPASASLTVGDSLQLDAALTPEGAASVSVEWSVNTPGVVSVNNMGLVNALSAGRAVVTAYALGDDDVSASAIITVAESTTTSNSNKKSGGGCDTGIVFLASALAAVFLCRRWFSKAAISIR
jgi:subtilisin family serine protease